MSCSLFSVLVLSTISDHLYTDVTCCHCRRFVDALGEPQRPCSRCSEIFDSDSELAVHIAAHENQQLPYKICPMCNAEFPTEMPQDDFVVHVNKHFD